MSNEFPPFVSDTPPPLCHSESFDKEDDICFYSTENGFYDDCSENKLPLDNDVIPNEFHTTHSTSLNKIENVTNHMILKDINTPYSQNNNVTYISDNITWRNSFDDNKEINIPVCNLKHSSANDGNNFDENIDVSIDDKSSFNKNVDFSDVPNKTTLPNEHNEVKNQQNADINEELKNVSLYKNCLNEGIKNENSTFLPDGRNVVVDGHYLKHTQSNIEIKNNTLENKHLDDQFIRKSNQLSTNDQISSSSGRIISGEIKKFLENEISIDNEFSKFESKFSNTSTTANFKNDITPPLSPCFVPNLKLSESFDENYYDDVEEEDDFGSFEGFNDFVSKTKSSYPGISNDPPTTSIILSTTLKDGNFEELKASLDLMSSTSFVSSNGNIPLTTSDVCLDIHDVTLPSIIENICKQTMTDNDNIANTNDISLEFDQDDVISVNNIKENMSDEICNVNNKTYTKHSSDKIIKSENINSRDYKINLVLDKSKEDPTNQEVNQSIYQSNELTECNYEINHSDDNDFEDQSVPPILDIDEIAIEEDFGNFNDAYSNLDSDQSKFIEIRGNVKNNQVKSIYCEENSLNCDKNVSMDKENSSEFQQDFVNDEDDYGEFSEFRSTLEPSDNQLNPLSEVDSKPCAVQIKSVTKPNQNYFEDSSFEKYDGNESQKSVLTLNYHNTIIKQIFEEEVKSSPDCIIVPMNDLLKRTAVWPSVQSIDRSPALSHQWTNSEAKRMLLSALHIETNNIIFGSRWKENVPRFAANLGFSPLEPSKPPETKTQYLCVSSNSADPSVESVPDPHFDWSGSGLVNPLDRLPNYETLEDIELSSISNHHMVSHRQAHTLESEPIQVTGNPTSSVHMAHTQKNCTLETQRTEPIKNSEFLDLLPDISFMQHKGFINSTK